MPNPRNFAELPPFPGGEGRTVLVTGADGRIGGATVRLLGSHGWNVVALAPQYRNLSPDLATLHVGSATSEADVAAALEGADAVVHLAAIPHWDDGTPYDVYSTNVVSTFNVLTQAAQAGIGRAVIASSIQASGIPGNHHRVLPPYFPLDEELPPVHDEWYSLSKFSDELTARMVASRWGMDVVALRFPWVDAAEELDKVIETWTADPLEGMRLGWSYLDLRDAALAVEAALHAPISGALVVQLAAQDTLVPYATEELLDEYAPSVPRRAGFPGRSAPVDTSRARELLGFTPQYSIDLTPVGLADSVRSASLA